MREATTMERQKEKLRPKTEGESTGENKPATEDGHRPPRAFKVSPNAKRTVPGRAFILGSETAMRPKRETRCPLPVLRTQRW